MTWLETFFGLIALTVWGFFSLFWVLLPVAPFPYLLSLGEITGPLRWFCLPGIFVYWATWAWATEKWHILGK